MEKSIQKQVLDLKLEKEIMFLGQTKNPLDFLNKADVLVLSSFIEGLPAVILEAMYCGVPVVSYDVGGISEAIINNKTGKLIPFGDELRFQQELEDLLSKPKLQHKIIENAKRMVLEKYDNNGISNRFLQEYKKLSSV